MCWISVHDQLPEDGDIVDCWFAGPAAPDGYREADVKFLGGSFVREFRNYGSRVTHWRYPPPPPQTA